jgi:transposase-like protein
VGVAMKQVASAARIEELSLHQENWWKVLRQAIADGDGETILFRLVTDRPDFVGPDKKGCP